MQRNVAKRASPPSQPQREQHPPSPEVRALLAAAHDVSQLLGLFIGTMIATGARRAEVCGLRWSDVDFEESLLGRSPWAPGMAR